MRELLDEFAEISKTCNDGLMGIEEFSQHLKLPITKELQELFHLYDRVWCTIELFIPWSFHILILFLERKWRHRFQGIRHRNVIGFSNCCD